MGIDTLAIVLFAREQSGSFAVAGGVAAAFGVGNGALTPLQGRLVDRLGHARVLVPLAALHAISLGALVGLGLAGAPVAVLVACGFLAGASLPPVGSIVRQLLTELTAEARDLRPTVFALDAIVVELVFIGGPLLTAVVVATLSPAAALACAAGMSVVGTMTLLSSPASRAWRPSPPGERRLLGALASPSLQTIVAYSAPLGFAAGATEVTIVAFSDDMGSRGTAGVLLALWSVGSAAGGLVYGARGHRGGARSAVLRLSWLFPLCSLPLVAAPSIAVMAGLIVLAGCLIAPLLSATSQLTGDVAAPGSATEAFTWPVTALLLGVGAGAAAGGALVEASGWRAGFVAVVVAGACCATLATLRGATLPSAAREPIAPTPAPVAPLGELLP
jgi:MFS family permease